MFFTTQVLSRKGSLGTIWIAAHLEKKLKRQQISQTDIRESVDQIMNPEAPFALRLSSQLLFGLARVYRRQVSYLLQDCNDALNKIHDAFVRTTLPEVEAAMALNNLTMPENFFTFDAMEINAFCGFLADAEDLNEDIALTEALSPAELCSGNGGLFSEGVFRHGSSLGTEDRELPLLTEIIPEEELTKDVMRERSSVAEPRLSSIAEAVTEKGFSKDFRESDVYQGSLEKANSLSEALEMRDSIPQTPDNRPSHHPPMLPTLDFDESVAPLAPPNVHSPLEEDKGLEEVRAVSRVAGTLYKKMHKQAANDTVRKRTLTDSAMPKMGDAWLEMSSVKQVTCSDVLFDIWKERLFASLKKETIQFDIERAHPEIDLRDALSLAPEEPIPGNERDSLHEGVPAVSKGLPEMEAWSPDRFVNEAPAGESPLDLPILQELPDEISQTTNRVFTHLKRRFTEASLINSPVDIEVDGPSPKRRRLPSIREPPKTSVSMFELMQGKSRLDASRWFYQLMVLKAHNLVKLDQDSPYSDIQIQETAATA